MKDLRSIVSIILTASFFAIGLYAQELPADVTEIKAAASVERDVDSKGPAEDNTVKTIGTEASLAAISSTAAGGFWNTPSTWVGGVVPGAGDNVTITAGSTVVIDVDVNVADLTVGDGSLTPAVLIFTSSSSRVVTINGNLTISGATSALTTGTGSLHEIIVGGNLTNNGIFDLCTNNDQAGAGLHFRGASNSSFSGNGSITDIRTIQVDKGNSPASTVELTVSNFTVKGSTTDGLGESYLTLINGTFKISGLFAGNHRTFANATYTIPLSAGIWLNNPNYTIVGQPGNVTVIGNLTLSAGVYNVGTEATNTLSTGDIGGLITVDGGSLNVSGAIRRGNFPATSYRQTGGVTTTCIAGNFAPCFHMLATGSGGKLVIQTASTVNGPPDFISSFSPEAKTMVTFGNANTPGTSVFTLDGTGNSVAIDTSAGQHRLFIPGGVGLFYDVNIGPGGILDLGGQGTNFSLSGTSFVNDGILKVTPVTRVRFGLNSTQPITYSGSGVFSGPIANLDFMVPSTTLDPGVTRIRTRNITAHGSVINANRIILGLNDNFGAGVSFELTGNLDSAPVFDMGTGKQSLTYRNLSSSRTMGPELNPTRELSYLEFSQSSGRTLTVTGGDLTVNGEISNSGIIDMSGSNLRHLSGGFGVSFPGAYVKGTIVRRYTSSDGSYSFNVGDDHPLSLSIFPLSPPSIPVEVAVTAHDATLAGLPPATSLSYSWEIVQTGTMTSRMDFHYGNVDVNGNDSNYRAWRSAGGGPKLINSTRHPDFNLVTVPSVDNLTGSWGLGAPLPPISISGTVFAANGVGIRNAYVKISGGSLPSPILVQTGNFGTYSFPNLDAGVEYTLQASAKRKRFATSTQVISSTTNVTNVNFTANPEE
jgi:hypothetical protein